MKLKLISAIVAVTGFVVGCGQSTPSDVISSSQSIRTQSFDSSGGGESGGGTTGTILGGNPLVTVFNNDAPGGFQQFSVNGIAEGYTYDWYDRPGAYMEVCGLNAAGQAVACRQASNDTGLPISLTCMPSAGVSSFRVTVFDATLHRPSSRLVVTSVTKTTVILPSPQPYDWNC